MTLKFIRKREPGKPHSIEEIERSNLHALILAVHEQRQVVNNLRKTEARTGTYIPKFCKEIKRLMDIYSKLSELMISLELKRTGDH